MVRALRPPAIDQNLTSQGVMAGIAGGPALLIWWLFFSRAAWVDRIGGLVATVAAMAATWPFLDVSIATGAMGFIFPILAMPGICLAFVLWALTAGHLPPVPRRASMAGAVFLACGVWALVRTGGFTGSFDNDLSWRWTPTAEERLLAQADEPLAAAPAQAVAPSPAPAAPAATPADPEAPAAGDEAPLAALPAVAVVEPEKTALDWPGGSADATATAWCAACASPRTGRHRRPRRSGAGPWARAGRRSPSTGICSTRRSSVATRRLSPPTASAPARRCGCTATRRASTSRTAVLDRAGRRRSATDAPTRLAPPVS